MDEQYKIFNGLKPAHIGAYSRDEKQKARINAQFKAKYPEGNTGVAEVERVRIYLKERQAFFRKKKEAGEIYTDGPYKGLPIMDGDPNWLAELFLDTALNFDIKAFRHEVAINAAANEDGVLSEEDVAYFEQRIRNSESARPEILITADKMPKLNAALDDFLHKNHEASLEYTRDKDADYFFYWLVKNMTNSDTEDLAGYVKRYADFTADKTFAGLSHPAFIGNVEDVSFLALNADEYEAGLETPYLMLFWAEKNQISSVLPFIRYGIENTEKGKVAYIYAVQRRKDENAFETELDQQLDRIFAGANSGVKEHRNITPSMVCMLAVFIGMLKAKGIKEVKAPDFIVRRWGDFWKAKTDEDCVRIQSNATNKFLLSFVRLSNQFEGLDIQFVPNEVDSFLHLKLSNELKTKNQTLAKFYEMGKRVGERELYASLPQRLQRPDDEFQR